MSDHVCVAERIEFDAVQIRGAGGEIADIQGGDVAVLGWSEGRGALAALGAVGVYYCVLWLFRHKIEHTIHFSITKHY